jgi:hypothetical protein
VITLSALLARVKSFLLAKASPADRCSSELMLLDLPGTDEPLPRVRRRRRPA